MAQSQGRAGMGWVRDAFSSRVLPRCQDAESGLADGQATAGHCPGVGIAGEELRAVQKFDRDEFGPLKKMYLQNMCYGSESQVLSHVRLLATPRTIARQAPLSYGISQTRILEWVSSSRGSSLWILYY